MSFRIGYGYDVHRLEAGLKLALGGIIIPHSKGCVAHSDGDVLIHAICDAMLGAAAMRDIGFHFPDNNNEYKNIDSKILLKRTYDLLKSSGYELINIDSTICLQNPKIQQHIPKMIEILAQTINVSPEMISIKATTTEKLGFIGNEEGISAHAVVLIQKKI